MNTIRPGQVVSAKRVSVGDNNLSFEYAAPRGKKFICVFLEVGESTTEIDVIAKYKSMGWVPDSNAA
jgi:hypothetical protein